MEVILEKKIQEILHASWVSGITDFFKFHGTPVNININNKDVPHQPGIFSSVYPNLENKKDNRILGSIFYTGKLIQVEKKGLWKKKYYSKLLIVFEVIIKKEKNSKLFVNDLKKRFKYNFDIKESKHDAYYFNKLIKNNVTHPVSDRSIDAIHIIWEEYIGEEFLNEPTKTEINRKIIPSFIENLKEYAIIVSSINAF